MKKPLLWVLVCFGPFLLAWPYLFVSRSAGAAHSSVDLMVSLFAVAVGILGIFLLTPSMKLRTIAGIVYVPMVLTALFWFSLFVVCGRYGDCP